MLASRRTAGSRAVSYDHIFPGANPTLQLVLIWCRKWGAGVILDLMIAHIELREN